MKIYGLALMLLIFFNGKQERKENLELMEKLEKSMLESLSSDIRLMNELPATKKLAELKKQYDETLDRYVWSYLPLMPM